MSNCNPSLYRVRQLQAARETTCDAPAYITNAATALEVQVSPQINVSTEMVENNVAKGCLTQTPQIPSTTSAEATFTAMLKGSGSLTQEPAVGIYFEGCGLKKAALKKFTGTGATGLLSVGESWTTGGGAAGRIRLISGALYFVEVTTGTLANSDVLTGTGGGTITISAIGDGGFAYAPSSDDFQTLTLRLEEGGQSQKEIFGALGTFTLNSDSSNPAQAEFSFSARLGKYYRAAASVPSTTIPAGADLTWTGGTGSAVLAYASGSPYLVFVLSSGTLPASGDTITAGAVTITLSEDPKKTISDSGLSSLSYENTIPPILQCSDIVFGSLSPVIQNVSFDAANEVTMRQNVNSCDGYAPALITSRKPTLSVNPEAFAPSEYDIYSEWTEGAVVDGTTIKWGSVAGNTIVLWVNKLQWQTITDGDRDGIAIFDAEGMVVGDCDFEYQILFV